VAERSAEPAFKWSPKVFRLVFSDPDMDGLVVRARSVSLGTVRRIRALPDDADALEETLRVFVPALVSWNLRDEDDQPVPATTEALNDLDMDFVSAILAAWMSAVTGEVPDPLERRSNGGGPSLEASIPMEALSASP